MSREFWPNIWGLNEDDSETMDASVRDMTCKSNVLLAALENKTAARTGEVLAADINWLPSADSNHGHGG